MTKKNVETLEERLLSPKEIDAKISLLQQQKKMALCGQIKIREIVKEYDFEKLLQNEVFDYDTYYEVTDLKNNTVYYLNGVQVASLFGMNEEHKKMFMQKETQGQVHLDDKLVSFYYREIK